MGGSEPSLRHHLQPHPFVLLQAGDDSELQTEERFKIPSAVNHAKNEYSIAFDTIDIQYSPAGKLRTPAPQS
jgi:hypothetical protein